MSIIGAKETKDLAEKMQKSLHQNQWEGVEHLFPDFKKSYNRLFEEINRIKSYEN
jgi:hypothetical protein